tara:strand:- start:899 stop:2200 length:1302 start_codon:yes stop_codon:yes gene_type:complete
MTDYYDNPTIDQAKNSIRALNAELSNLTPSAPINLFEIDISKIAQEKNINLSADAEEKNIDFLSFKGVDKGILRFHNNIKVFNSYIVWQGKTYYPAPISASGFETTTKGTLPQPTLSITSQTETGQDGVALLRYEIRKMGDIIGAKVTRRRTFAKFLDAVNFGTKAQAKVGRETNILPEGFEPDPFAYLPSDIYFVERKQNENKTTISYQLSSILDLEGVKLPKRRILADKCSFQYRGLGCWYQHAYKEELEGFPGTAPAYDGVKVPLLNRAQVPTLLSSGNPSEGTGMLESARPVATDSDQDIISETIGDLNSQEYKFKDRAKFTTKPDEPYVPGNYVYIVDDTTKVKYYFVCKKLTGGTAANSGDGKDAISPPNKEYWVADECSKSLTGCRLRWGAKAWRNKSGKGTCEIATGHLPFGGFPAAKKIARGAG